MAGSNFEKICEEFLKETFPRLLHLRPGQWEVKRGFGAGRLVIAQFDQYEHLAALEAAVKANRELAVALGSDYLIKPDVIIIRYPEEDATINAPATWGRRPLRFLTRLKASERAFCARSLRMVHLQETLACNVARGLLTFRMLVRRADCSSTIIVVVTGEPAPNRIASIALGTGDIDCVYHFALPELVETVKDLKYDDAIELVNTMVQGKRLRDIADLPLDLVI